MEWWDSISYAQIRLKGNDRDLSCEGDLDLFCITPEKSLVNHEQKVQWSIFWHKIKEGFRGACKGNRPFQEAVNLFLVLAEFLLQRTGDWFLGMVGWYSHWDFRQQWLLTDCIRITKICKFSAFIFDYSLNMGTRMSPFFTGLLSDACCRFDRTFQMCHFLWRGRVYLCSTFPTWYPVFLS